MLACCDGFVKANVPYFPFMWTANQRTTEFTTLINPETIRVLVGIDIPDGEMIGQVKKLPVRLYCWQ